MVTLSLPIKAENSNIVFNTLEEKDYVINYDLNPIINNYVIDGEERTVFTTSDETFYWDNDVKIILLKIEDAIDVQNISSYSVTMNTFLNDFYYTNSFVPKNINIDSHLASTSLSILAKIISESVVAYLKLPARAAGFVIDVANIIAAAIIDNPPEYSIRLNIKYYRNKQCSTYLGGQTFNMVANGVTTPTKYAYNWEENPTLGVVSQTCKLQSQKYTYQYGIGE